MKLALLCKRYYTNKDLIEDRFGRLFHLPIQLVNQGHEGFVIAGDLHTRKQEQINIDGIQFYSMPLSVFRLYNFFKQSYKKIEEFDPDILIASGDSYLGYIGQKVSRNLKIPFVFDVYDDYTVFGTNKIPGMKILFYKAAKKADLVITSSEPLRDKLSPHNKNILVIENGFNPLVFHSISKDKARALLKIPLSDTVIGYFGSITEDLGMEILLDGIEILRKQIPNLLLLIAGHNGMNLDFESQHIDYRGFLPQQDIPVLINACDVVVIPYLPGKQVQQSNACKIAEYIACGVPIVATKVSNHEKIFSDAPQSLCEPGSPESMASAILAQLKIPQLKNYPETLTWEKLAGKLSKALESIDEKAI